MNVFLLVDIYESSKLDFTYIQEWESLESIQVIKHTLEDLGHKVYIFEPIREKNKLLRELSKIKPGEKKYTILWNLVEGFFSRNREAYVPSLAEFLGFPFTGSDAYAQILTLDKYLTKQVANELKIPTCRSHLWISPNESLQLLDFPFFIKPNGEGSSLGVSQKNIIYSIKDWELFINSLDEKFFPLLLEEYLPNKEYTVGILGSRNNLYPTRVLEVRYPSLVYGSEIKSKSKMPESFHLTADTQKENFIQEASIQLAKRIGVSGYARIDWKEDKQENPKFLEINLTPGLSSVYSALPICAKFSGISYSQLLENIIKFALEDYELMSRKYGKY